MISSKKNQDLVMLLLVKNKKIVINKIEMFEEDDQLTGLLAQKKKKELEIEKSKMEKRKKKLEKNKGKEEEDDNPGSDTNYLSADEEKDIDQEKKNKLFEFEYHIALINLIARCCGGENSATEGMAQDLITMEKCVTVIGNPNFNGSLKAAYLRFLGEVWLNTFRKVISSFQFFF